MSLHCYKTNMSGFTFGDPPKILSWRIADILPDELILVVVYDDQMFDIFNYNTGLGQMFQIVYARHNVYPINHLIFNCHRLTACSVTSVE